jgi:hypothetical protein
VSLRFGKTKKSKPHHNTHHLPTMNPKTGLAYGRVWHLVDAKDKVLGKLAQRVSIALRGKYKPIYEPSGGEHLLLTNHIQQSDNPS